MKEPVLNQQTPDAISPATQGFDPQALDSQSLNLRDIHLPDPVSWWPIAPGWWIILASLIAVFVVIVVARKIYQNRQLNRDIKSELEDIKQQFRTTQNKVQLAKALSILLRRASISYYPAADIAGLTGKDWLCYLDNTLTSSTAGKKFNSEIGEILLSAPYLPDNAELDFDAQSLICLCESWLHATHKTPYKRQPQTTLIEERLS